MNHEPELDENTGDDAFEPDPSRRKVPVITIVVAIMSGIAFLFFTLIAAMSICGLFGCGGGWGSGSPDFEGPVKPIIIAAVSGTVWVFTCPWTWKRRWLVAAAVAPALGLLSALMTYKNYL